jgi:hypothetical protein
LLIHRRPWFFELRGGDSLEAGRHDCRQFAFSTFNAPTQNLVTYSTADTEIRHSGGARGRSF